MSLTMEFTDRLVVVTCWCGINHAVPENLREFQLRQHRDGKAVTNIYCPLGHHHRPTGESEAAKLQRQLTEERERAGRLAAERDQTEASLRAQKAATTRAKRRHAAGVCPVCQRSFQQLRRHMASQHPDFDPEAVAS